MALALKQTSFQYSKPAAMLPVVTMAPFLPDLRAEAAYVNLVGLGYVVPGTPAEDNGLYQSIDGGSMEAYASDLERAYIKKWLDEGAENN
jgi:hypothetical protein